MAKRTYYVAGQVTVSTYTLVEADSEAGVGGPRMGNHPNTSWVIDDADGTPVDLRIENGGTES